MPITRARLLVIVLLLMTLVACAWFVSCTRPIDRVTESGSAYSFRIGDTKAEAFAKARELRARHAIQWISPAISDAAAKEKHALDITKELSVGEATAVFSDWRQWDIHRISTSSSNYISLLFDAQSRLSNITLVYWPYPATGPHWKSCHSWPEDQEGQPSPLTKGMSYSEVHQVLTNLVAQEPFAEICLLPRERGERLVTQFSADDFGMLQKWHVWNVEMRSIVYSPDVVRLTFDDKHRLVAIRRIRTFDPFPF